jgi:hypothetical protein
MIAIEWLELFSINIFSLTNLIFVLISSNNKVQER